MFLFISFMFFLPQNWRTRGWNRFFPGKEGFGTGGRGEVIGKGDMRMNTE
jgi:hypothetical protein